MKKYHRYISAFVSVCIIATQAQSFASANYESDIDNSEINWEELSNTEDRTGKIVRVYVDEEGNPTEIVEVTPDLQRSIRAFGDITLVSSRTLTAKQTSDMKAAIQGMTQTSNIAAMLLPFLPAPFSVFASAARVGIFAQDVRWAGAYGHKILLKEYCKAPHTSYSHYFEYEVL